MFESMQPWRLFGLMIGLLLATTLAGADDSQKAGEKKQTHSETSQPIPEQAKAALEAEGLRVINGTLLLPDEAELSKQLHEATKLKKGLVTAEHDLHAKEQELLKIDQQTAEIQAGQANLNAQAAGMPRMPNRSSRLMQNQLQTQKNLSKANIDSLKNQRKKTIDQIETLETGVKEKREALASHVRTTRATADDIAKKWEKIAVSNPARDAVQAANEATGKKFALKPSPAFKSAEAQLKALEKSLTAKTKSTHPKPKDPESDGQ